MFVKSVIVVFGTSMVKTAQIWIIWMQYGQALGESRLNEKYKNLHHKSMPNGLHLTLSHKV